MNQSTHGLCKDCLSGTKWDEIKIQKVTQCFTCHKEPTLLYNQQPYCTICYLQTTSSPLKSEISSIRADKKGHHRNKSYYRPIDKSEYMKKSLFSSSGKLIRKIQKLIDENSKDTALISYLSKKAILHDSCTWDKIVSKVSKNSSIIYFFFSKTHIIGAFHLESVPIEGQSNLFDQEAGIFICQRSTMDPQFSRVKSDAVIYDSKNQCIKFGSPSSFDICFDKNMSVSTQLFPNFEWKNFFIYRP